MNPSKPVKPVAALKHKDTKRAHIPSAEEAGYEAESPKVKVADCKAFPRNPVVHRGQDPELFWLNKYGSDDTEGVTSVDIRSLYRHEHIAPETLIKNLHRVAVQKDAAQDDLFAPAEMFGNAIGHEELDKVSDYYTHSDGWTNRLIQGDSLLVMTSLLEREGMAGAVQCIFLDPPYGINYNKNWQLHLHNKTLGGEANDDGISGEPEQVKAFRDTWELGIHSYLSYLRERLLVARELLHESGSCFVQISDENVHLVRNLMDEVFGSENFMSLIPFAKTAGAGSKALGSEFDYLIWYAKQRENAQKKRIVKYRQLYLPKESNTFKSYKYAVAPGAKSVRPANAEEKADPKKLPEGWRLAQLSFAVSQDPGKPEDRFYTFKGERYDCGQHRHWKTTNPNGLDKLAAAGRLIGLGKQLNYIRYFDDFPATALSNDWNDTGSAGYSNTDPKVYVVQTDSLIIQRCILMTTDPGDLVLDPTCGSGTTAYVAEQWGRRWITTDTSRIAINIAKSRLMTATFPYYQLYDQQNGDLRQGFNYKQIPHIMLENIANDEKPDEVKFFDQPHEDKKRLRVAGPFTVETLQSYEPISPEELARQRTEDKELGQFEDLIFTHLKSAGVKTGDKKENAVFVRLDRLASSALHAEGWYATPGGEKKAYLHIGPKFGTVSKQAVTEAIKACRDKRDGDWLLILGFAFESGITELSRSFGNFQVSIVRMHDDLLQQGLLKKDKKAASFVTIGEPDIRLQRKNGTATVEIAGLDIYDPIKDEVKSRDVHDIAYWMLDDNYDGSNFVVRQVFFCGGDKDEFDEWKRGLSELAKAKTKKAAEQTLKIEINEDAFARLYGHTSHPFEVKKGQKIAVRVVSQFGEETTKILEVGK
jgi:adenine-specific DNA-methyltransferase